VRLFVGINVAANWSLTYGGAIRGRRAVVQTTPGPHFGRFSNLVAHRLCDAVVEARGEDGVA
jgi:hypothetical protein